MLFNEHPLGDNKDSTLPGGSWCESGTLEGSARSRPDSSASAMLLKLTESSLSESSSSSSDVLRTMGPYSYHAFYHLVLSMPNLSIRMACVTRICLSR